jgi:hypothetical protein
VVFNHGRVFPHKKAISPLGGWVRQASAAKGLSSSLVSKAAQLIVKSACAFPVLFCLSRPLTLIFKILHRLLNAKNIDNADGFNLQAKIMVHFALQEIP